MTAEIAVLNKYAVALAADSAVTISVGDKEEKIFDSADKLFELSRVNPIAIMIYNGMEFAQIPLQTLICKFRNKCSKFDKIETAAKQFLQFLNEVGAEAPEAVKDDDWASVIRPLIDRINLQRRKAVDHYVENIPQDATADDIRSALESIPSRIIETFQSRISTLEDANFIGDGNLCFDERFHNRLMEFIDYHLEHYGEKQKLEMANLAKIYLTKNVLSDNSTGIVIAGFGSGEIFPTLVSFEIDGMVCNRLKFVRTNHIDIDREGKKAAVIPFAQKEMVERFLYGLDEKIQQDVTEFCEKSVPEIRRSLLDRIEVEDQAEKSLLSSEARAAEKAFIESLSERAFKKIRSQSQQEIETMVEFMPKPELAQMAEALVNLTSLKRRVSRGFETVGGPIDVVVISQTEGFIWVKRKHYFDPSLNTRYFQRVKSNMEAMREPTDAAPAQSRKIP